VSVGDGVAGAGFAGTGIEAGGLILAGGGGAAPVVVEELEAGGVLAVVELGLL
jgi:hypothetical protein